jgi:hypothetical protein
MPDSVLLEVSDLGKRFNSRLGAQEIEEIPGHSAEQSRLQCRRTKRRFYSQGKCALNKLVPWSSVCRRSSGYAREARRFRFLEAKLATL